MRNPLSKMIAVQSFISLSDLPAELTESPSCIEYRTHWTNAWREKEEEEEEEEEERYGAQPKFGIVYGAEH